MPSRKQRRRRQKDRRHEYEYVYVDEEGQEVEVEEEQPTPAMRGSGTGKAAASSRGRASRKVEPPSWRRVGRRALFVGPALLLIMYLLKPKNDPTVAVFIQAVLFLIIFLPFSYMMDTMLYRSYLKRTGQAPRSRGRGTKQPKAKT